MDHSIVTIDELNSKVTDRDGRLVDLNRKISQGDVWFNIANNCYLSLFINLFLRL